MLKRRPAHTAAILSDLQAQVDAGYLVKVAEWAREHAATKHSDKLLSGIVTLLATAITDPPKPPSHRRPDVPVHGTLTAMVDGESITIDPYVSASQVKRKFRAQLTRTGALAEFKYLSAARALVSGKPLANFVDIDGRALDAESARVALEEQGLADHRDGRTFKTALRRKLAKRFGLSLEELSELTRHL